jgi:hypothetical protein
MPPRDPTLDVEPDFEEEAWEGTIAAIVEGGKSAEEAVEILRRGWRTKYDRDLVLWNEYVQQQRTGPEPGERGRRDPANDPMEEQPEETEEPVLRPTPSFLDLKPAHHVLKRLEKKEFVELWYFTAEGCKSAAAADLATPDETFSLINTGDGMVRLQTLGASSVSSKAIKDEHLNWYQLTEAKTRMLGCMRACGWSKHEITQLAKFYLSLDTHPFRSQPYGLETIMRYQSRVRRDWVINLRSGNPYSIAEVNDELMKEFRDEIGNEVQAGNNVSSLPSSQRVTKLTALSALFIDG